MSIITITPQNLSKLIHSGAAVELIDVRTPVEYHEVHVSSARNVPLYQLNTAQFAAGRSGVRRSHRHLRHGDAACPDALESGPEVNSDRQRGRLCPAVHLLRISRSALPFSTHISSCKG